MPLTRLGLDSSCNGAEFGAWFLSCCIFPGRRHEPKANNYEHTVNTEHNAHNMENRGTQTKEKSFSKFSHKAEVSDQVDRLRPG